MPEITKAEGQRTRDKGHFAWMFFAFFVVFVYFFALGSMPLVGPDEPRYAQVAREMFERGDWITPTLGGFNWFEKPALLYWLEIVSYKIFGVSEFAARFGSALCGLGTIFSLWILGKKVQSSKFRVQSQSIVSQSLIDDLPFAFNDFANWLFLVAASSIGILVFSRGASFDIILTFPVTASLVAFFIFDQSTKKTFITYHFLLTIFYFFIGVALLAKGLVGIVFPLAIVAFYFLMRRKLPCKRFVFSLFWGAILSLLVASLWYAPMFLRHGWNFFDEFFLQQQFQRYTSNKFQHPQPFWFFLIVLPLMTLPWLPFFLLSIWDFISRKNAKIQGKLNKIENENSAARNLQFAALKTFALAWLLVPLVFFSFSGSKLPGYILPALPAAIILTAQYVFSFARENRKRAAFLQALALATFIGVVIALRFFANNYAREDTVKFLINDADARGYAAAKILNFDDISHNAEFYGAGRLIRAPDGKQRLFTTANQIVEELKSENGGSALVLVGRKSVNKLTENYLLDAEALGDNSELLIVAVKLK
jgi:4-amino-4-deoxy-L-arabinose transferase-like glycosyltransferase